MFRITGTRNNRRHPWIAKQIFQEELCPTAGKSAGPVGNSLAAHGAEQPAVAKRQRRQYSGVRVGRQWENAFLGLADIEGVVDLDKVWLFSAKHCLYSRKITVICRCHTHVAANSLRLPLSEFRQRLIAPFHIVQLKKVNFLGPETGQ